MGTIVLETSTASEEVHAMAKRGGEYNQLGARGWEWFELRRATDGALVITLKTQFTGVLDLTVPAATATDND